MVLEGTPRLTNFWEENLCQGDLYRELLFLRTADKDASLNGESKLTADSPEKGGVHGLKKRRGAAKVDSVKASAVSDSSPKMPEEEKRGLSAIRTKDASTDSGQDLKQKPADKKASKPGKGAGKLPAGKRVSDSQPLEELRAKEEAETNRKVTESLDNLIRQTIRCDSYMNLGICTRPGDKPLQRLRSDVFENHVAGKFARGFKVDSGSDSRDTATDESFGIDNDADGLKDPESISVKGMGGLGRGSQHSLKVASPVVAFTQAAAKGTDLQNWHIPPKITSTKCEKCGREFYSTLNYRRHLRGHRRSLNPEKEDLSKERPSLASFWDKLSPEQARSIVRFDNMEIEEFSGQSALKALSVLLQQPGSPSLPQGMLKAGAWLYDIIESQPSEIPLSSELLSALDDASEKTFLCGGTSVAVQRFVFSGDAGKVGLEERNLVASMGFHIELKLVKAWMANKEAEALRCQQALFKEEEAAQQRRAKLLEKKRMKKIRQKERKGCAAQSILQELENESLDEDGNIQGIGEEDDSQTATGSSSSSIASAQDLASPEPTEIEVIQSLDQADAGNELVQELGGEVDMEQSRSTDEGSLHQSRDGQEGSQLSSRQASESLHGEVDVFAKESIVDGKESNSRSASQGAWDGSEEVPVLHSFQGGSGKLELQSGTYFRKVEQERTSSDLKRRDFDRSAVLERKPSLRIPRDRPRSDYFDPLQRSGRDTSRSFDGRYGDASQAAFKPLRKPSTFFGKGESGSADLANLSRGQQYRTKPAGAGRASAAGTAQGIWTRKVPQPTATEPATRDGKEGLVELDSTSRTGKGLTSTEAIATALSIPVSIAGTSVVPIVAESRPRLAVSAHSPTKPVEKKAHRGDAATPVLNDGRPAGSADDLICPGKKPETDEEGLSGALLVGSMSVPIPKSAMVGNSQTRSVPPFLQHRQPGDADIASALGAGVSDAGEVQAPTISCEKRTVSLNMQTVLGDIETAESLDRNVISPGETHETSLHPILTEAAKLKAPSLCSPEKGDIGRYSATSLGSGSDRLPSKPVSWVTPAAGRHAKVWRPVSLVGDRHDSSAPEGHCASGESPDEIAGSELREDVDDSGISGSEREGSPEKELRRQQSPGEQEFSGEDYGLRQGSRSNDSSAVGSITEKDHDQHTLRGASSIPCGSVGFELESPSEEKDISSNNVASGGKLEVAVSLASGLCSLSSFVEVVGTFFNERWRAALERASADEILELNPIESNVSEAEEPSFLDMVRREISSQSAGASPRALSVSATVASSVVENSLETLPVGHGGLSMSRILGDSDPTGVEDLRRPLIPDEQGLDGPSSQDSGVPQALSSEEDVGMRDAASVDSEQYVSGNETSSRSHFRSSSSFGGAEGRRSEAFREAAVVGGSAHMRYATDRQERWHRHNTRDRFSEQRYMPRRRAPMEKNC